MNFILLCFIFSLPPLSLSIHAVSLSHFGACNAGACTRSERSTKLACSSAKSQRQCAATRTPSKHDAPRNRFLHPTTPRAAPSPPRFRYKRAPFVVQLKAQPTPAIELLLRCKVRVNDLGLSPPLLLLNEIVPFVKENTNFIH